MDSAAIFSVILKRQALRREAKLRLLDVCAEYQRAVQQALWAAHIAEHGDRVRAEVLAELRGRHGQQFGGSVGGLWAVRLLTSKWLSKTFEERR